MPKTTPIISCEMQTGETQKHTNNLQQNFKKKMLIKNVDSHDEFRQISGESEI
jgi:hypothetical protein